MHPVECNMDCGFQVCDYRDTLNNLFQLDQFVHQFKNFVCDYTHCGESFDSEVLLRKHKEKKHNSDEELSCQQSGSQFKTCLSYSGEQHVNGVHKNIKLNVGEHHGCQYRTAIRNCLMRHKESHSDSQEKLSCQWPGCDYSTFISENLNQHIKTHTEEKSNECKHSGNGMKLNK